jgi:hypothetical protein
MIRMSIVCSFCVSMSGCGDDDGGGTDAGRLDAASPMRDAGRDSGTTTNDSGGPDAGGTDAGGSDAGFDSGMPIAGRPGNGELVISELHAAPVGYADDALAEWVEVFNPSESVSYNLNGCIFSDRAEDMDHTIATDVIVGPGEYAVLSSADFTEATHGFVSDYVYGSTGTGLSGGGDDPTLRCDDVVVDTVDYGADGFPSLVDVEGSAIQLDVGTLDAVANDTGSNWCYGTMVFFTATGMDNLGTPGMANESCAM